MTDKQMEDHLDRQRRGITFKLAIIGSRNFYPGFQQLVTKLVDGLRKDVEIISGGARGPDTWAVTEAKKIGLAYYEFKPVAGRYGFIRALFERNNEIAYEADAMVAFWDRESTGTLHAIDCIQRLNKPYFIVRTPDDMKDLALFLSRTIPAL